MNTDKDKLIIVMAEVFGGFMASLALDWHEAVFRFVKYSNSHKSRQCGYIHNRIVFVLGSKDVDAQLEEQCMGVLTSLMTELFIDMEKENEKEPVVAVLKIDLTGQYSVKFDYSSTNALEINLIRLGLDNSYFSEQDVDIPEDVKEFQREMAANRDKE